MSYAKAVALQRRGKEQLINGVLLLLLLCIDSVALVLTSAT